MLNNANLIDKAVRVARRTNVKRAKVAAIALSTSGHIIAYAHNRRLDGNKRAFTEHAEIGLLHKLQKIKAFERFGSITILVVRVNTIGLVMAKPCRQCQKALDQYRNQITVFYTENNVLRKL